MVFSEITGFGYFCSMRPETLQMQTTYEFNKGVWVFKVKVISWWLNTCTPGSGFRWAFSGPMVLWFHCAIRRRLIPNCFHEVFVNFLGSHSLPTKIFYHRSHFNFLHFASLTHCPLSILSYKSNQAWANAFYSPDDFQWLNKDSVLWNALTCIRLRTFWSHLVFLSL